jgi:hypothetical protein
MAMGDKTERYRLEIDVSQAIGSYKDIIELNKIFEKAAERAAALASEGGKAHEEALKREAEAERKLLAEVKRRLEFSKIDLRARQQARRQAAAAARERKRQSDAIVKSARSELQFIRVKQRTLDKATRQEIASANRATKARQRAGRELLRQLRVFPQVRQETAQLVGITGTLNAQFDAQGNAVNRDARQLLLLINRSEALRQEFQRLAAAAGGVQAQITPAGVAGGAERAGLTPFQIRQLGFGLERLGVRGVSAITSITTALAGIPVGTAVAVGGIAVLALSIVGLTKLFITLGKIGVDTFSKLLKGSVEVAAKFDSVEASFRGVFQGNEKATVAAIRRIRDESIRLGVDVEEIVRKALPLVGSLSQALSLGELAVGLARLDPKLGEQGAVRAIQAGLVGNLQPLRKSFDIDVGPIVEAQKRLGDVMGLIVGLGQVLDERGLGFEDLANTFDVQTGRMVQRWEDFQLVIGEPIVEAVTEELSKINKILDEGVGEDLEIVAKAIGEAAASVARFVGGEISELLESLTREDLEGIARVFLEIGAGIQTLIDYITGGEFKNLTDAFTEIGGSVREATEFLIGFLAAFDVLVSTGRELKGEGRNIFDFILPGPSALIKGLTNLPDAVGASERAVDAMEEALRDLDERTAGVDDTLEELMDSQRESITTGEAQADAIIALNNALRLLGIAEEKLAEEQDKVNKKMREVRKEAFRDRLDSIRKLGEQLVDAERKASERRVDEIVKFQQKMQDLIRKHRQRIADADLADDRKAEDDALKHTDKLEDIERNSGKKRIEIEEDFQDKLDEIRRKFDFQAEEAIRNNDAVALLRIRRRMEFELNEARIARDQRAEEEDQDAQERRDEAQVEEDRRNRDRALAHERRIADLNKQLGRELLAEQISMKRRFEELKKDEERRRHEILLSHKRASEQIKLELDRRLADLRDSLADEIQAVREATATMEAIQINSINRVAAAYAARLSGIAAYLSGGGTIPGLPGGGGAPLPTTSGGGGGFARGGPIFTGQPVIVGDPDPARPGQPNPELIVPAVNGMVIPLSRMMMAPPNSIANSNIFNNQRSLQAEVSMLDPNSLSPAAEQRVKNIVAGMLMEALNA